jgi:membrane protease YdiL (CAAX protease family)
LNLSHEGQWKWPLILVFMRFFLAVVLQLLIAGIYLLLNNPTPLKSAGHWFTVYGSLIDIGCLALIVWQIQKEGKNILDLVNIDKLHILKGVLVGLFYFLLFMPVSVLGIILTHLLIYQTPYPPQLMGGIPLWGAIYSVTIFPVLWGLSEQITYQGYSLTRLEYYFGNKWLAIALVSFGWMLQHTALPLVLDWQYAIYRMISFFPLTIAMPLIFLRTKRLMPFIIAHWAMDAIAAIMGTLLPILE